MEQVVRRLAFNFTLCGFRLRQRCAAISDSGQRICFALGGDDSPIPPISLGLRTVTSYEHATDYQTHNGDDRLTQASGLAPRHSGGSRIRRSLRAVPESPWRTAVRPRIGQKTSTTIEYEQHSPKIMANTASLEVFFTLVHSSKAFGRRSGTSNQHRHHVWRVQEPHQYVYSERRGTHQRACFRFQSPPDEWRPLPHPAGLRLACSSPHHRSGRKTLRSGCFRYPR